MNQKGRWRQRAAAALIALACAVAGRASSAFVTSDGLSQAQRPVYRNLQVIPAAAAESVDAIMRGFNRALGVECSHCHVPDQWHLETKPAFGTARNMMRMIDALNDGALAATSGVGCWTCHRGATRPSRLPGAALEAAEAKWPATLAAADDVKLGMAVYAASLGVECTYCHVDGDWKSSAKSAYRMVATMNGLFEVFPKFMPAGARTQCFMCHKGAQTPERAPGGGA